jgi:hypothetical protein
MDKNNELKDILNIIGINFDNFINLDGLVLERSILLEKDKYIKIQQKIKDLKKIYSSTYLNCLHANAEEKQKWPLLNLTRQILNLCNYNLIPLRLCDGYTIDGKKKYKRFFIIKKKDIESNGFSLSFI